MTLAHIKVLAQLFAKLVLGRNGYDTRTGRCEFGDDGVAAQQLRAGHHDWLSGGGIEVEVARDAVFGCGRAGDDRHIVRAGE